MEYLEIRQLKDPPNTNQNNFLLPLLDTDNSGKERTNAVENEGSMFSSSNSVVALTMNPEMLEFKDHPNQNEGTRLLSFLDNDTKEGIHMTENQGNTASFPHDTHKNTNHGESINAATTGPRKRSRGERISAQSTPNKKRKVVDDDFYDEVRQDLRKLRPRALTIEEKMDIIAVQARIRHDFHLTHQLVSPGQKPRTCDATNKTAKLLGRSNKLCGDIWTEYITSRNISEARLVGNRKKKPSVVPDRPCVISGIQLFIRKRQSTCTKTVARDVMNFCIESGFINVARNDTKQVKAALRSVQRFLRRKEIDDDASAQNKIVEGIAENC